MIENIVLNTGIVVASRDLSTLEQYSKDRYRSEITIGNSIVSFNVYGNTGGFKHFGNFTFELEESEFFLAASIWATNDSAVHQALINTALGSQDNPHRPFDNIDVIVSTMSDKIYLIKMSKPDHLSDRFVKHRWPLIKRLTRFDKIASCVVMKYNWAGDSKLFEQEFVFETIKSGLTFANLLKDAEILNWGDLYDTD